MSRKVVETPKDGADSRRFREFTVKLFVGFSRNQKQSCRLFQGLSIGIHLNNWKTITASLIPL